MSSIDYRETLSIPSLTLYRPADASERPDDIIASLESPRQRRAAHLQGKKTRITPTAISESTSIYRHRVLRDGRAANHASGNFWTPIDYMKKFSARRYNRSHDNTNG